MISQPTLAVPIEFAEAYFENRLHADAWTSASDSDKAKALTWADTIIQNGFQWEQGAYTDTEWAVPVQYAVCEEALWLLKIDPSEYPVILTKGLLSGNAGAVSGTFSKDMVAPLVCPTAVSLVGVLGVLNEPENGTIRSTMLEG